MIYSMMLQSDNAEIVLIVVFGEECHMQYTRVMLRNSLLNENTFMSELGRQMITDGLFTYSLTSAHIYSSSQVGQ
jgi:hypothetical protein